MTSFSATAAPFWSKFHPSHETPVKHTLPPRPATSPTLTTPPVPPKDTNVTVEPMASRSSSKANASDYRWSEVVPPATALTFAAIWDPEDGLVTFSGAALSASEGSGCSASPEDADARSQTLTVDFLNLGTAPSTAKDSTIFPYSQSRFAASEVSTQCFPVSPTRRSSVGTGMALDTAICPQVEKQAKTHARHARNVHHLNASTPNLEKPLPPRGMHQHSSSQDSTTSHTLSVFGSTIYKAIRRVASPRRTHTRAERYAFLRGSAERASGYDSHDDKSGFNTMPKSPGFRSLFNRSIWLRSGIGAGRDEGLGCGPQIEDCDGISLDSGFDCMDVDDSAYESWPGEHTDNQEELDAALQRDVNRLKSAFSWTTTSTSRYIDVAAYLENDSDTDSTVSSLGVPVASTASPFDSHQANSDSIHAHEGDCDSPWLPVEPPTPRATLAATQHTKPQRNLLRKPSKSHNSMPSLAKLTGNSKDGTAQDERERYQICPQCHLRIEYADLEVNENIAGLNKGKGRANSQPSPPDSLRDTTSFGRSAAVRSSSSPASLAFPHSRSQSLPGSRTATPAEVLARASYNHEWASPIPSRPRISHVRSPSAPQPSSPVTITSMHRRSATPTRPCQHFSTDVRDVLRGVRSGVRPSTPIPGMPLVPPKNRPPPTSFRPVSAAGRERDRPRRPMSASGHTHEHVSQLSRSHGDRPSIQGRPSIPLRTRSLESLRGTAHALASASAAPLRTLWRAGSFIRHSRSDQPRRSDDDNEDGVWVCVDITTPDNKPKNTVPSEDRSPDAGLLGPTIDART